MPRRPSAALACGLATTILAVTMATAAGCVATDKDVSGGPGAGGPGAGGPGTGEPGAAGSGGRPVEASAPTTWRQTMRRVDDQFDIIRRELLDSPAGSLRTAADAAKTSAALVRLGYGVHRRRDVKGFARLARDCESWLLRIAAEADQGRDAIARDLLRTGQPLHCVKCHDAAGVRRW
ncbi:MAG: hypothetical protein NXI31_02420 [bacterium]|nr:hypothetical protein [bacterium]